MYTRLQHAVTATPELTCVCVVGVPKVSRVVTIYLLAAHIPRSYSLLIALCVGQFKMAFF